MLSFCVSKGKQCLACITLRTLRVRFVMIRLTAYIHDHKYGDYVQPKTVIGRAPKRELLCIIVLVRQSQLLRSCPWRTAMKAQSLDDAVFITTRSSSSTEGQCCKSTAQVATICLVVLSKSQEFTRPETAVSLPLSGTHLVSPTIIQPLLCQIDL